MNRKIFWLSWMLILGATFSLLLMLVRGVQQKEIQKNPVGINAFMENATYIQYDKFGKIHTRLRAPHMEHFSKNDTSFFTKPTILIYTTDRIPWHIKSNHGRSQKGTETVYLWGNVVLHQPELNSYPETTITTNAATIYPKRSFAETDQNVTIRRPGSIVKGKGVTANFETGIIKLLTHSRGIYVPTKK